MIVTKTKLPNLLILEPKVHSDARGYFMENYNKNRYAEAGIECEFVQDNESSSEYGVVRGLHYQLNPYSQAKLIRVVHGAIIDIALDIRVGSPTYGQHEAIELSAENKRVLFVPRGFAHGFSVISPNAIVQYKCDSFYNPDFERGISCNDSNLGIDWMIPSQQAIISAKDLNHPNLKNADNNFTYKSTPCNE